MCAPFVISESNKIEDHSNSTVKIYDYYKPEFEASEVKITAAIKVIEMIYKILQVYKVIGCDESGAPIPQLELNVTLASETTSANYTSATRKRSVNLTGLNPDFVNMDVEMATPGGKISVNTYLFLNKIC